MTTNITDILAKINALNSKALQVAAKVSANPSTYAQIVTGSSTATIKQKSNVTLSDSLTDATNRAINAITDTATATGNTIVVGKRGLYPAEQDAAWSTYGNILDSLFQPFQAALKTAAGTASNAVKTATQPVADAEKDASNKILIAGGVIAVVAVIGMFAIFSRRR